jgi:hypothetical protein
MSNGLIAVPNVLPLADCNVGEVSSDFARLMRRPNAYSHFCGDGVQVCNPGYPLSWSCMRQSKPGHISLIRDTFCISGCHLLGVKGRGIAEVVNS